MDFCDDILDENDRYAFLLGSALRHQDHDHFLEIYDRILPKDIDSKEVESIKERARQLAAVPEEEFATLAVHARDYSLAQPQWTTRVMYDDNTTEELSKIESIRGTASVSSISSLNSDFPPELCQMDNKPDLSSLMRTSRYFGPQSEAEFSVSDASDSGICLNNSMKHGSVSDNEDNERPGVFDYVQTQTKPEPKVEIISVKTFGNCEKKKVPKNSSSIPLQPGGGRITIHNEQYLNSDNDDDFEAIRSDDSGSKYNHTRCKAKFEQEIEMVKIHRDCESPDCENQLLLGPEGQKYQRKVARSKNNQMYDEAFCVEESNSPESYSQDSCSSDQEWKKVVVQDDSDDVDLNEVIVHKRLYDGDQHTTYLSMNRDFREDYMEDDDNNDRRALQRLDPKYGSYEKELHFRTYNSKCCYNSIEQDRPSVYKQQDVDSNVNFGLSTVSRDVKIEKSFSSVKSKQPPFGDPVNIEKIGQGNHNLLRGKFIDNQKITNMPEAEVINKNEGKKKKKKKKLEESDEKLNQDINGNPLEEGRAKSSSKQVDTYKSQSTFPSSFSQFGDSYYSSSMRDHEDIMQSVDQKYHEKKARKNKKKELEGKKVITSDNIPGHRGGEQLDSLLDFIEGQKGQRKQKKEQQSPHQSALSPSTDKIAESNINNTVSSGSAAKREKSKKKRGHKENSMDNIKDNLSDGSSVSDIKEITMGPNGPIETTTVSATFTINSDNVIIGQRDNSNDNSYSADANNSLLNPQQSSGAYIFTDFESIQKPTAEAAFQTVSSKKKKKLKEPDNRVNGTIKPNFPPGVDVNNKRLGSGAREYVNSLRQKQVNNRYSVEKRSYTPPPTPTSNVETKPNDRAFSPSAFPALGKNSCGRRYSTGDAKEIQVEKEIDSDIESCKSVPAAASDKQIKEAEHLPALNSLPAGIRPLPVVSYAKVVGGQPQLSNQQIKASSMDDPTSDVIMPDADEDLSSTKERRHSLGNIPMPVPNHLDSFNHGVTRSQEFVNGERTSSSSGTSNMSTSSKASSLSNSKYGSTENLTLRESSPHIEVTMNLNPCSDTDFPPITNTQHHSENDNHVQNISASSDIVNKWNSPPTLVNNHQTIQSSDVSIQNTKDASVCSNNSLNSKQSAVEIGTNHKVVHTKTSTNLSEEKFKGKSQQNNKVVSSAVSSSNNNKSVQQTMNNINSKPLVQRKIPPVQMMHSTKPSSKTVQSVIFLDRKFSEQTPNLGISFGFEPELDFGVSSSDNCSSSKVKCSNEGSKITNKNVINNSDTDSKNKSVAEASITNKEGPSSFVIEYLQPSAANNKEPSSQSNRKLTHPPNGVILKSSKKNPSPDCDKVISSKTNESITAPQSNDNDNMVCYTIEQNSNNGITFSAEIVLTSSTTPQDNCTIYATNRNTFTSCEATVSDTGITCSTTSSYVWPKLPSRDQDPNYHKGKYDQEKVVSYLYNEWCNVMQDGEKVCDDVAVYGRDLN